MHCRACQVWWINVITSIFHLGMRYVKVHVLRPLVINAHLMRVEQETCEVEGQTADQSEALLV